MSRLQLPNGDVIEPGDVLLFEGYPYRYETAEEGFVLVPVYWGDSPLDLAFESAADLEERWGPESEGTLSAEEWRAWIADARASERFSDDEIDAIEREVLPPDGLLDRIRRLFE